MPRGTRAQSTASVGPDRRVRRSQGEKRQKPVSIALPGFLRRSELATRRPHTQDNLISYPRRVKTSQEGGGAGGGTLTHKSFRSEMCGVSAFTRFATPALSGCEPRQSRRPRRKTPHLAAAHAVTLRAQRWTSSPRKRETVRKDADDAAQGEHEARRIPQPVRRAHVGGLTPGRCPGVTPYERGPGVSCAETTAVLGRWDSSETALG